MPDQIDESVKQRRLDYLMRLQARISREEGQRRVGETTLCLVESVREGGVAVARSWAEAPETDGVVMVEDCPDVQPGDWINVRILRADAYDLWGVKA